MDDCLCGSSLAFKSCCLPRLPSLKMGVQTDDAWAAGDWLAGLLASRAELTQYTIWHKSNTLPALASGNPAAQSLLKIDVAAMSEIAGQICLAYHRLNRDAEIPSFLERIRNNSGSPGWQRKVTYHHASVAHASEREQEAVAEFAKLGSIDETEQDLDILQLFISLHGETLSLSKTLSICDAIIRRSESIADRIQYNGLKGMRYAFVGDNEGATTAFAEAVRVGKEAEGRLDPREGQYFALALTTFGVLSNNRSALQEAATTVERLLGDDDWTSVGRASLWSQLGEVCRYSGDWKRGADAYRAALQLHPTAIDSVFLAECQLRLGQMADAIQTFNGAEVSALGLYEKTDHAFVGAAIAVETKATDRLQGSIRLLEQLRGLAPHFEERRLRLILQIKEAIADGASASIEPAKQTLTGILGSFNRYFLMQPNAFGVGLNINAIVEDFTKRRKT